jgi:hypothetical protein
MGDVMRAILIPVDEDKPVEVVELGGFGDIAKHIHCDWVERVIGPDLHVLAHDDYDPVTRTGGSRLPSVNMFVDEQGHIVGKELNRRASRLYAGPTGIVGDVLLLGEDEVDSGEGYAEPDTVTLPNSVTVEKVEAAVAL